jgi:alcohol dehydrogenase
MKALVHRGSGLKANEDRPKPEIQAPGDAIVRMVKTTICGTDPHILAGVVRSDCANTFTCRVGRRINDLAR